MDNNNDLENFKFGENDNSNEVVETKEKKKFKFNKICFNSKQVIILAVICVILALLIAGTTVCIVKDVNPFSYISSVVTNDKKQLVGKWESVDTPGLSAYVFRDDGTYDSYITAIKFEGAYKTNGYKLTLINPQTKQEVTYNYSVSGDTLKLVPENPQKGTEDITLSFKKVENLSQKSIDEIIDSISENQTENK